MEGSIRMFGLRCLHYCYDRYPTTVDEKKGHEEEVEAKHRECQNKMNACTYRMILCTSRGACNTFSRFLRRRRRRIRKLYMDIRRGNTLRSLPNIPEMRVEYNRVVVL